jgi:RHS repeat-associated protein
VCAVGYGNNGLSGITGCNLSYDEMGNVVSEPAPGNTRQMAYLVSGRIRSLTNSAGASASFRYDPFGALQELDVTAATDARKERHYGPAIEKDNAGTAGEVLLRSFTAGPLSATRHGAQGAWVFAFGESRGNRAFTDDSGNFVQEVDYTPFGAPSSSIAAPGSALYSKEQWNGGDSMVAFGVSALGARLYDPALGRFLSPDPLFIRRGATTTNPYAFALNDPINNSDPSGLDNEGPGSGNPDNNGLATDGTGAEHPVVTRPGSPKAPPLQNASYDDDANDLFSSARMSEAKINLTVDIVKAGVDEYQTGVDARAGAEQVIVTVFTRAAMGSDGEPHWYSLIWNGVRYGAGSARDFIRNWVDENINGATGGGVGGGGVAGGGGSGSDSGPGSGRSVSVRSCSDCAAHIVWTGFSSGQLDVHYRKHGSKFPGLSQAGYLRAAKEFAIDPNSNFKEAAVGNFVVKYDPSTGRTFIGHMKDRQIRTFYIDDGRDADAFQAAIANAVSISQGRRP